MDWKEVELIAEPGTEVGIVEDKAGKLVLVTRRAGEKWPHVGNQRIRSTNTILPGYTRYIVTNDEV